MRLADVLSRARELGVARLDAQLWIAHHLDRPRTWVMSHDDEMLSAEASQALLAGLSRLAAGVPLAYLRGEREFHGLALTVSPAVLVPRPDTEVLVDWALELLAARPHDAPRARVADLGTGSGAIALAVRAACPQADVLATDISAEAIEVAQGNAARLGLAVEFRLGSWWQPLEGQRFDLLLSNPPYIGGDDPHLEALTHEPRLALTPGGDGLSALRLLADGAPRYLSAGGWVLLEHGHDQAGAVGEALRSAGLEDVQTRADLAGLPRCTAGRLPQR